MRYKLWGRILQQKDSKLHTVQSYLYAMCLHL